MSRTVVRSSLCLAVVIALLLLAAYATAEKGGGTPMVVSVTNGGYDGPCDDPTVTGLWGDIEGCTTEYSDNDSASCNLEVNPSCIPLRVKLISGGKTLALDTRGTDTRTGVLSVPPAPVPRTLILDFKGCVTEGTCVRPPGTTEDWYLKTPGLLEVFLNDGVAKFWFTDSTGVEWRLHWNGVIVRSDCMNGVCTLTVTAEVAAGLSKLTGKRTKPGDIANSGFYTIPFKLTAYPKLQ